MGTQKKHYDQDLLVLDIAEGAMTYGEIAEKHGLAEVSVNQIARGDRRPELQPLIDAASQGFIERARRRGANLVGPALEKLGKLAAGNATSASAREVQRKACVDILNRAMGDPSRPVNIQQQVQGIAGPKVIKTPLAGPDMIDGKVTDGLLEDGRVREESEAGEAAIQGVEEGDAGGNGDRLPGELDIPDSDPGSDVAPVDDDTEVKGNGD